MLTILKYLKGYIARYLAKYLFILAGTFLTTIGITQDELMNIILGLLSVIAGGAVDVYAHAKAVKSEPPLQKGKQ